MQIKNNLLSLGFIAVTFVPLLGVLALCIDKVVKGRGLDAFMLGNMPIPKLLGAGASYLDVLIFMLIATLLLTIALFVRWRHYRLEDDFKKKYGIKDKSSFTDRLIDDLSKDDD